VAGRRGARSGRGWDAIPPREGLGDASGGDGAGGPSGGGLSGGGAFGGGAFGGDGTGEASRGGASGGGGGGGAARRGGAGGNRARGGLRWSASEPGEQGRSGRAGAGREAKSADPRPESEIAREICLRQLAVRPRTRAELAKALAKKEISDEVIAEVLDRYDEVGIIDDAAFARAWVSSRHHGRGLARRALATELRRKGVDAEVASEALETVDDDAEAEAARALVDRKLRTATGTPDQIFRRLVGMLARKGYPAGIAIRAVKDALAARDAAAAEFADQIDPDALADHESGSTS
jgi:regulatory protein